MKKVLLASSLIFLLFAVSGFANTTGPIIGGGTGTITTPSAFTIGKSGLDLGFAWVSRSAFVGSVGFGILEDLDLSVGFDMNTGDSATDPYLHFRGKYQFSGNNAGGEAWAFGLDVALALGDGASALSSPSSPAFTLYLVNSFNAAGFLFSWGVGYTFGLKENVNFLVGVTKEIIENLYIDADFSNYSTRGFYDGGALSATGRGIGNFAARVSILEKKLNLSFGLFDAFDASREIGLRASFKLNF